MELYVAVPRLSVIWVVITANIQIQIERPSSGRLILGIQYLLDIYEVARGNLKLWLHSPADKNSVVKMFPWWRLNALWTMVELFTQRVGEGERGAGVQRNKEEARLCNRFWHSLRPKEERSRACCNYNVDIRGFQRVYLSLLYWRKWARLYFKCIHIHSREGLVKLL